MKLLRKVNGARVLRKQISDTKLEDYTQFKQEPSCSKNKSVKFTVLFGTYSD